MPAIRIVLAPALYAELCEVAAGLNEPGYSPAKFATDLVASEMAARRLPRVAPGRCGAHLKTGEPEPYRVHVSLPASGLDMEEL
jgi:hypothetical protein